MTEIEAELITAATNADAIIESGRDIDGFCAEMMDLCEKAANEIKRLRADVNMKDIIERLEDCRAIDGSVSFVEINENTLADAKAEIIRLRNELIIAQCTRDEARWTIAQLRAVAGAVSIESGQTFGAIKGTIKNIPSSCNTSAILVRLLPD